MKVLDCAQIIISEFLERNRPSHVPLLEVAINEGSTKSPNYTIFGQVDSGMAVVNKIASVPVGPSPSGEVSKPTAPIFMKSIDIKEK